MGQRHSRTHSTSTSGSYHVCKDTESQALLKEMPQLPPSRPLVAGPIETTSMPKTMPLEYYMRKALLSEGVTNPPTHFFRPSKTFPAPTLKKGVKNRILLFVGSFNPPHIGHKMLLTHAFFRSMYPNTIAAIITPSCAKSLKKKFHSNPDVLVLSRSDRARLWEDAFLTPWSWVNSYAKSSQRDVEEKLIVFAAKDGFEIEFVVTGGTDYLTKEHGCEFWDSGAEEVIVCDAFRPAHFVGPDGSLGPLRWCQAWNKADTAEANLLARISSGELSAAGVLHVLYPEKSRRILKKYRASADSQHVSKEAEKETKNCLEKCLEECGPSWMCRNNYNRDQKLQFVPVHDFLDPFGDVEVSSTAIRLALENRHPDEIYKALRGIALNAKLLAKIMQTRKAKKEPVRKQCKTVEIELSEARTEVGNISNTEEKNDGAKVGEGDTALLLRPVIWY